MNKYQVKIPGIDKEINGVDYIKENQEDIPSSLWEKYDIDKKEEYFRIKRIIKNSIRKILYYTINIGKDYQCKLTDLNKYFEKNLVKENEFYEYLNENKINYEIDRENNIIKGVILNELAFT